MLPGLEPPDLLMPCGSGAMPRGDGHGTDTHREGQTAMSDADRERWNARYAAGEYAARTYPSRLLAAWIGRLPRGRALDVACGLGRNAIHLAANGYAVDAMDISGVALARARERAETAGVAVNWIETDLERPDIARDAYDVIVVARFLDRP